MSTRDLRAEGASGEMPPERRALEGAILGTAATTAALGVAHLVAGLLDPQASPVLAVGQTVIDLTPEPLKAWAIRTFGQRDKAVLVGGIIVLLLAASAAIGVASLRRLRVGIAGIAGFAAVGVAAALTRPSAGPVDAVPTLVGAGAAGAALLLLRRSLRWRPPATVAPGDPGPLDRRRFLLAGAATLLAAGTAGGVGNLLARRLSAAGSRAAVRIPLPASPAPPARGAELSVPGLGPFFTPNVRFYRVDTALLAPAIDAADWRLRIHGMVDREIELDHDRLLARPLIERDITLACVSNPVGGRYVGNARWIGVPLAPLLEEAGVRPGADQLVSRSVDGFTSGTPTAVVMDGRDAMLAVAMNGEPLPIEHGFPVRMIVPGLYGYVSATKWLVDLELTTFDAFDPYWVERGWAERAPVKTMSRIDTPTPSTDLAPGEVVVAGVAWAQHVGIARVEVSIDGGPWEVADLAAEDTIDTWRQWAYRWRATSGGHRIRVRATDHTGAVQTAERREPFPDGATGHHEIVVRVA